MTLKKNYDINSKSCVTDQFIAVFTDLICAPFSLRFIKQSVDQNVAEKLFYLVFNVIVLSEADFHFK